MSRLQPSLREIEDRLFDPSDELLARWCGQGPPLPEETRQDLENTPRARFLRDLRRRLDQESIPSQGKATEPSLAIDLEAPLPGRVAHLIDRHIATRDRFAGTRESAAGQMRLISHPLGLEDATLDWDMGEPLAVLLWRETSTPGVWSGWPLASETDYASDWDILLEEEDQPYEPLIAMVQLWNPVQFPLAHSAPIIGQVSPRRLQTLATAFADSLMAGEGEPRPSRPGSIMERLVSNGELLLCGTPLGGPADPRRRYQELYYAAAGILRAAAQATVARINARDTAPAPMDWATATWQRLAEGLRDLARQCGQALLPLDPVVVMGTVSPDDAPTPALPGYRIPGLLAIESLPEETHGVLKIRLTRLGREPLTLRLLLDGDPLEWHQLEDDKSEVTLFLAPQPGLALEIRDKGGPIHTWELNP